MCLRNCNNSVEELLKTKKETFTCYKIVIFDSKRSRLYSPFYYKIYKPGENKSDSKRAKICTQDDKEITRGIHVYTNYKVAKCNAVTYSYRRLIKLTCSKKDLLGVNFSGTTAVFKKVHLSEKEYNKAIKYFNKVYKLV